MARIRPDLYRLRQAGAVRKYHSEGRSERRDPAAQDVAQVEFGSQFFDIYSDIGNGHPASSIILKQSPGSNAAEVIEEIKKELEEIKKKSFPPGMDYELAYDVSKFLEALD